MQDEKDASAAYKLGGKKMLKRILTAIVCLALFVPSILFFEKLPLLFLSVMTILTLISSYEICGVVGVRKAFYVSVPTYLFALSSMILVSVYALQYFKMSSEAFSIFSLTLLFVYVFVIFALSMFSNGGVRYSQACELIATLVYVIIGFASIVFLINGSLGSYAVWLVFIGVWLTDSGAYFVGSFLGKHKLIPEVSPKKTVEGAVGGIVGGVIGYVIYGIIINTAFDIHVNYINLLIVAIAVSIIGQAGDLIASFIKREKGIKDYGNLFPGHGGVLDRFDSAIAVAPVIILLLNFAKISIFSI